MSCKRHCEIGQRSEHCVTPGLASLLATDFSNTEQQEGIIIFKSGNSIHCFFWDSGRVKVSKLWNVWDGKGHLLVIVSNPSLLCYLELVSQTMSRHVLLSLRMEIPPGNLCQCPVTSTVKMCFLVWCDSGIALVEEMLHIVKENKSFWAGAPRVWFHSIASLLWNSLLDTEYIYPLDSPSCH